MGQLFLNLRAKKWIMLRITAVYFSSISEAGMILKFKLLISFTMQFCSYQEAIHSTTANGKSIDTVVTKVKSSLVVFLHKGYI